MLAYSIMSYDFMKSQVVETNEAEQPCAWLSVAGVIYVYVSDKFCFRRSLEGKKHI